MSEHEDRHHVMRCGFRIDPITGEELPLTPEQEAWIDRMLDEAYRQTVAARNAALAESLQQTLPIHAVKVLERDKGDE